MCGSVMQKHAASLRWTASLLFSFQTDLSFSELISRRMIVLRWPGLPLSSTSTKAFFAPYLTIALTLSCLLSVCHTHTHTKEMRARTMRVKAEHDQQTLALVPSAMEMAEQMVDLPVPLGPMIMFR